MQQLCDVSLKIEPENKKKKKKGINALMEIGTA